MFALEDCKKYLPNTTLTDEEILKLRDSLYELAEIMIEDYYDKKKAGKLGKETERQKP